MVVADNLAAHTLGSFFCNFSTVHRFCRFCDCTKDKLTEKVDIDKFILRTQKGCNNNIVNIEAHPELCSLYGIKSNSCQHSLQYFHVIDGLPPDIAHDIFEGIAIDVINDLLLGLISVSKVFTFHFVNKTTSFEYSKIDRKNKPQQFKIISSVNFKNKQTACEVWNLIKLVTLILGPHVTEGNIYWGLYINFCQLVERLRSLMFYSAEIIILSEHIERFFTKYMDVFEGTRLKPKAHFVMHYPKMIERFGLLVKKL